jgi:hypothetical protein
MMQAELKWIPVLDEQFPVDHATAKTAPRFEPEDVE